MYWVTERLALFSFVIGLGIIGVGEGGSKAVASPTEPERGEQKKFQVGPNIYHFFKFKVKNRRNSAEEAKT